MSFKNINKLLILILFFLINSCKTLNILSEENNEIIDYNEVKENKFYIELSDYSNYDNLIFDSYKDLNINKWDINSNLIKLKVIDNFGKDFADSLPVIPIILNNQFISINHDSVINIYNLDNLTLLKSIILELDFLKKTVFPTSLSLYNNQLYISYSNGYVVNCNLKGDIIWIKKFLDIIKTPIKIYDDSLLILLTNKIISIESSSGILNWQFLLQNNNEFQVLGGNIVDLDHLIFFILPNNRFGQVDTILGKETNYLFPIFDFENNVKSSLSILHTHNNILTYFDSNKYFSSIDINKNLILLNKKIIKNVNSSIYFNNALITFHNDGFLKSYNIINKNIFWEINISNFIDRNDNIVNISQFKNSLIVFFKSGKIIQIDLITGNILSTKDFKLKNIVQIIATNLYYFVIQFNGKITVFLQ